MQQYLYLIFWSTNQENKSIRPIIYITKTSNQAESHVQGKKIKKTTGQPQLYATPMSFPLIHC